MHFSIAVVAPLLAAFATAAPVAQGTAPGSVSVVGPTELPPNCYFPHGAEVHEIVCTYTSDQPGTYPEVVSTEPDSCKEDPEDGADVVCYLPGSPDFGKRSAEAMQDAYLFHLMCDDHGCRTTRDHSKRSADASPEAAAAKAVQEAYDFHIRIKWKRDLEEMIKKREAAMQEAYSFSIRIKF